MTRRGIEGRVPELQALQALLKRIQRDRGEQIRHGQRAEGGGRSGGGFLVLSLNFERHRQLDSQRLIQRNKNLKACDATVRKRPNPKCRPMRPIFTRNSTSNSRGLRRRSGPSCRPLGGASVLQLLLGISNGLRSQPEHAQRLLDEHDPASVARPGRRPPAVCITLISALRECWPLQECGDGGTSSSRPDQVEGSC